MHANYFYLYRAGGDGGLGELLKLEPIKEASHSPPSIKNITKPMTSTTDPCTHMHDPSSSSSQKHCSESTAQTTDKVAQKKESITFEAKNTFKSPTGVLAGDLGRNLSIKSPSLQTPKLTALPKHMQVAQLGLKAGLGRSCSKGSSLLTSTAMRFQSGNDGLNSILDGSPDPIPG